MGKLEIETLGDAIFDEFKIQEVARARRLGHMPRYVSQGGLLTLYACEHCLTPMELWHQEKPTRAGMGQQCSEKRPSTKTVE
jgi:hypothetical protein